MRNPRRSCGVAALGLLLSLPVSGAEAGDGEPPEPPGAAEIERTWIHWDFRKELNLAVVYSHEGLPGLSSSETGVDHLELSPRFPRTFIGAEVEGNLTEEAPVNRLLGGHVQLAAFDFHLRLEVDPTEPTNELDRYEFMAQDFWIRLETPHIDRLSLRIGQVTVPYGVNPVLAPRGRFLLPIEAHDVGFKWDWGGVLKGPLGDYDWELGATTGAGMQPHPPHYVFEEDAYMLTARLGAPTYWDFQYGLSGLFGKSPTLMLDKRLGPPVSRWRAAGDLFYKLLVHTMLMGQAFVGQDGFDGDSEKAFGMDGDPNLLAGFLVEVDFVPPFGSTEESRREWQNWELNAQLASVFFDLERHDSDNNSLTLEVARSLTDKLTLRLDWVHDFHVATGTGVEDDAIFVSLYYYGR
ncbi:MAG: hypothetical protein HY721_32445 [Planctomycetes bacterium]|nr:hypothetical protein [Planctomycetota bacterium]